MNEWQKTVARVVEQNPGKGLRELLPKARKLYRSIRGGRVNRSQRVSQKNNKQRRQRGGDGEGEGKPAADVIKSTGMTTSEGKPADGVVESTGTTTDEGGSTGTTIGGKSRRRRSRKNSNKRKSQRRRRNSRK